MAGKPEPPADGSRERLPDHAAAIVGRLVPNAFGVATGVVAGLGLFVVTVIPVLRGEPHLVEHVGLLSQYFYGYRVSIGGALLAAAYGFAVGYPLGSGFASVRNFGMAVRLRYMLRRAEQDAVSDLLDHL